MDFSCLLLCHKKQACIKFNFLYFVHVKKEKLIGNYYPEGWKEKKHYRLRFSLSGAATVEHAEWDCLVTRLLKVHVCACMLKNDDIAEVS